MKMGRKPHLLPHIRVVTGIMCVAIVTHLNKLMRSFLKSVFTLVIALPLLFILLGEGQTYVTWGPWISAIALMLWLLKDAAGALPRR